MGRTTFAELAKVLRATMMHTGVPLVYETDGGPPFNSGEFAEFCQRYNIKHRMASAGYAQSNGRAELGVKSAKRIVLENINSDGDLETDKMVRALLQHRNTPIKGWGKSPAQLVYGGPVNDCLPKKPIDCWRKLNDAKEEAFAKSNDNIKEKYDSDVKELSPLKLGQEVIIQNMTGPFPTRWSRFGVIVAVGENRQYHVRVHGSRRVLVRNRKHIRINKMFQVDSGSSDWSSKTDIVPMEKNTGVMPVREEQRLDSMSPASTNPPRSTPRMSPTSTTTPRSTPASRPASSIPPSSTPPTSRPHSRLSIDTLPPVQTSTPRRPGGGGNGRRILEDARQSSPQTGTNSGPLSPAGDVTPSSPLGSRQKASPPPLQPIREEDESVRTEGARPRRERKMPERFKDHVME